VLVLIGIAIFRTEPAPAPIATELPKPASEPAVAPEPVAPKSVEAKPVEPEVREPPPAPPSAIREVLPDVPRSALNTISGTIRVIIRVVVDKDGAVVGAMTDVPGPSRYFERLATQAAKQWTFGPARSAEQRVMLVTFSFRRAGVTAHASPSRQQGR
jgi:TonB family protein